MTPDWILKLLEALKSPKLTGIVALATACALWCPQKWLPPNAAIPEKIHVWLFVAFLVSAAALFVSLISAVWNIGSRRRQQAQLRKERIAKLTTLSPDEQFVLLKYIVNNTVTQYLEMDNGVVGSLLRKHLLYQGSNIGRYNTLAINIHDDVAAHLKEHPELLSTPVPPQATAFERNSLRFRG